MADDSTVRRMAIKQRGRLLAGVMGAAERSSWWGKLTPAERAGYREEIILTLNPYHEFMLDLIGITDEDSMRNERVVELLESVHAAQRQMLQRTGG